MMKWVSMKSGLEGRNNQWWAYTTHDKNNCLNEVRPRRPEQYMSFPDTKFNALVSMKSGLEGRNNVRDCLSGFRDTRMSQ